MAANPNDAESQRDLGFALLQRVHETADPSLYEPAAAAFEVARALAPDDALVLVGIGGLHLGKHEFAEALTTGRKAAEGSPTLASARSVIVDALVELGRYQEADEAAGEMLALSTDLSTLARMRTTRNILAFGAAMAVLTAGAAPLLVGAADHLDSPNAKANHALDITDVYAFDGANSGKTVLVVDVNPLAGVVSGTEFATDAEYRFSVDFNGDFIADDVYTFTFGSNAPGPKQSLSLSRNGTTILTGKTGNANNGGGAKVYAGVKDDPFFFDLAGFLRWRDPDGDGAYTYTGSTNLDLGDFFKGTNVSAIVLEIPDSWLGATANFWATTVKDGSVVDRMGKPALNTVFMNPFGGTDQKDPYNQTAPAADVATWGGQSTGVLDVFNETATAEVITGLLLPDVLHLDVANLGKSTGTGFTGGPGGILNGRTLAEDVIDLELLVVTGGLEGHAVLSTDHVGANDAAFPDSFPYLAPAH